MSPAAARATVVDETLDLETLERLWRLPAPGNRQAPPTVQDTQLTILRDSPDDFPDRQIYLFVDDEPWGKVRYGRPLTREIRPGRHRVRAFNTLLSHTIEIDAAPGEHVRLRCSNGMPRAGWLLMIFLHVTYLLVRLERVDSR